MAGSVRHVGSMRRRRGYLLLEVVVSIGLLLMGLAVIGGQIQTSQDTAHEARDLARVMMLVEMKVAELDAGLVVFEQEADQEVEGDFTRRIPDHGWRMRLDPTVTENLWMITLDILYNPRETIEDEFEPDDAEVVHTVYLMRATPPQVDLQLDFGLTEEAIAQLGEQIPIEDFDPTNFDPSLLRNLDTEELLGMLPAFIQIMGLSEREIRSMLPAELRGLLDTQGVGAALEGASDFDLGQPGQGATPGQPDRRGGGAPGGENIGDDGDLNPVALPNRGGRRGGRGR